MKREIVPTVKFALAAALAVALALAHAPAAHADPSDRELVAIGAALALPDYMLGVTLHEGSHAIAAKLVGASIDELHLFPPGTDPHTHTFRFGWTYVHDLPRSKGDRIFFYIAPKLTDSLLLGAFAALTYTSAWPSNRYAQLSLTVLGTGLWVDFSKDLALFSKTNDIVKVFDLWCLRGWRQIPARLIYAAAVVGWGVVVEHGYRQTFTDPAPTPAPTAAIVPLVHAAF